MNILILNWRDPKHPLAGGAEIALQEHALYWKKMGADITWFGSSFVGAMQKESVKGITYLRKGSHYTVHWWAFWLYATGKLQKFDVVIDCFHFVPFFTPLYIKKTKIVGLIHEVAKEVWFRNMPWLFAKIGYHVEPIVIRLYKNIPFLTVSQSTKNDLEDCGISPKNVEIIHNGISYKRITKVTKEKIPTILFLGRISQDKGIKDAIHAYTLIYDKFPNTQFWIAGKEEKKETLKKLINNFRGKIQYFGFVEEKKKWELLEKAWVLIHPSTREGWGLTVIEANSAGTPVVGYDVPGLKDSIVHNKTGLLVVPTYKNLAYGIEKLLKNKIQYKKMSLNAKKWSKKFRWDTSTKKSWTMLQSL